MVRVNTKTILLLTSVLLVLGAYACGSSEPPPDIEATVEAKINEKLPDIYATAEARAEASVEEAQISKPFSEMAERFAGVSDRLTQINCEYLARETEGVVMQGSSGRPLEVFKIKITSADTNVSSLNPLPFATTTKSYFNYYRTDEPPYLTCIATAWMTHAEIPDFHMSYEQDVDGEWWFKIWIDQNFTHLYPQ